jgi:hypothetical protein
VRTFSLYQSQVRDFSNGKKVKKGKKKGEGVSDAEGSATAEGGAEGATEERVEDESFAAARQGKPEELHLAQDLFKPFSVGDVKRIDSTPNNAPPTKEDTIPGRYASVLFTTASQNKALFDVFEDMKFLGELFHHSESFQLFTQNAGIGMKEIKIFNQSLQETGSFHPVTIRFIEVLAENKRLMFIKEVAEKYLKLYQLFNKEEKITIISAITLSSEE